MLIAIHDDKRKCPRPTFELANEKTRIRNSSKTSPAPVPGAATPAAPGAPPTWRTSSWRRRSSPCSAGRTSTWAASGTGRGSTRSTLTRGGPSEVIRWRPVSLQYLIMFLCTACWECYGGKKLFPKKFLIPASGSSKKKKNPAKMTV